MPCVSGGSIEITPNPVVVGGSPVEAEFTVAFDAPAVRGLLISPDGGPVPLDVAGHPPPCDWVARHTFQPGGPYGLWKVEIGPVVREFRVELEGSKPRTRFAAFAVRPRQVAAGERLTVTGRLEIERHGDWAPLPGQIVRIVFRGGDDCGWQTVTQVLTGEDGAFTTMVTTLETGRWRAELDGGADFIGSVSRSAEARRLTDTQIVKYTITPYPDDRLKHSGILRTSANHTKLNGYVVTVSKGGLAVTDHSTGNPSGRFTVITPRSDGQWRAHFSASGGFGPSDRTKDYP